MRAVTEMVLAQALDDAVAWYRQGVRIPVCVNLFAASLADVTLPAHIVEALAHRELPADCTDHRDHRRPVGGRHRGARAMLTTLREHGIRIALDDFGSGYSALRYLRDLPIDEVKLDGDFIAPILVDSRTATIVHSVIDLAHALGVITVAEGVESAETAAALRDYGCDVAQGFYYSPPITAPAVLELLTCCPDPSYGCSNRPTAVAPSKQFDDEVERCTSNRVPFGLIGASGGQLLGRVARARSGQACCKRDADAIARCG